MSSNSEREAEKVKRAREKRLKREALRRRREVFDALMRVLRA
jgi:hypothetical protein